MSFFLIYFFFDYRQLSKTPFFRSENLLLEYKNGDECLGGTGDLKRSTLIHFVCDNSVSGQVNIYICIYAKGGF